MNEDDDFIDSAAMIKKKMSENSDIEFKESEIKSVMR